MLCLSSHEHILLHTLTTTTTVRLHSSVRCKAASVRPAVLPCLHAIQKNCPAEQVLDCTQSCVHQQLIKQGCRLTAAATAATAEQHKIQQRERLSLWLSSQG